MKHERKREQNTDRDDRNYRAIIRLTNCTNALARFARPEIIQISRTASVLKLDASVASAIEMPPFERVLLFGTFTSLGAQQTVL